MSTRLLLDTHIVLWWRIEPKRLRAAAREVIAEAELACVSVVSAWEVAINRSIGRLHLPEPFEQGVADSGFEKLSITFRHAELTQELPLHHRDPFDRMLVAQAISEGLTLVTHDQHMGAYDAPILWA